MWGVAARVGEAVAVHPFHVCDSVSGIRSSHMDELKVCVFFLHFLCWCYLISVGTSPGAVLYHCPIARCALTLVCRSNVSMCLVVQCCRGVSKDRTIMDLFEIFNTS